MAYVPVPKDLTKVKTKVALNLTKRQLIFFSLAAVVGIPFYLFMRKPIGSSIAAILMVTIMLPFFFDIDILFVLDFEHGSFTLLTHGGMYEDLKQLLGREVDLVVDGS